MQSKPLRVADPALRKQIGAPPALWWWLILPWQGRAAVRPGGAAAPPYQPILPTTGALVVSQFQNSGRAGSPFHEPGNIQQSTSNIQYPMKDYQALPGRARHSVRAFWRCAASRATHHVRGGQRTARPTRFMVPMHAKDREEALHEPGNIEHRTSNAEHRMKRSPHLTLTLSPPIRMGAEREKPAAREPGSADWKLTSGSWSQCMRKIERRLSMNRMASRRFWGVRGHVRALFRRDTSRRGKRRHVAALQDAVAAIGSWSQCMRKIERRMTWPSLAANRSASSYWPHVPFWNRTAPLTVSSEFSFGLMAQIQTPAQGGS